MIILLISELSGFQNHFKTSALEFEFFSHFVDTILPWKGRDRPHRITMDEEATLAPHVPLLQGDPPVPLEFLVPPIPQVGHFPPMSPEAFQAFITYWYA